MSSGQGAMLGEAIANEMQAMQASSAAFENELQESRAKEKALMAEIFAGYQARSKPQLSDAAMRVAKIIDQNPLLLKSVSRFVDAKLAEVSAAVSSVLGVTPEDVADK